MGFMYLLDALEINIIGSHESIRDLGFLDHFDFIFSQNAN